MITGRNLVIMSSLYLLADTALLYHTDRLQFCPSKKTKLCQASATLPAVEGPLQVSSIYFRLDLTLTMLLQAPVMQ